METEANGTRIDIDNLTLSYSGNQLTRVTDNGEDSGEYGVMEFIDRSNVANEYAYDANGNMVRDLNKGISNITYNLLNLPGEISFSDGRKVKYIYTADGEKVRTTYFDTTGSQTLQVDYCGNYILRNGVVDRILTPSGYIKNDTVYSYVKDYQGNVRSVVRQDGVVVESTDYYPYGTPFTTAGAVQPYKYGTKELDRMHGLDLYDSQARWYDSLLGRTTTMDPLAEKYYSLSPYLWCAGNPVKFIDPSGEKIEISEDSSDDFRNDYRKAYDYLKEHQASFVIDELELSPSTFVVKETNNGSKFDSKTNVIYWNPHLALLTNTGYTLTSAELLSHEAAHALNYDNDPESTLNRGNTQDDQYGNLEDKKVIEGPEQSVAIKLNRVNEFNRTRTDHFGTSYYVQTPYSTKIEGVVVLGQINSNK